MQRTSTETKTRPIRVLIVEPQPLLSLGLHITLDREADIEVVGTVAKLSQVEAKLLERQADVLLLNRGLQDAEGSDALEFIARTALRFPTVRALLLASRSDEFDVRRAFRAGAWGYLPVTIAPAALVGAVRAMHAGELALPRSLARQIREEATA